MSYKNSNDYLLMCLDETYKEYEELYQETEELKKDITSFALDNLELTLENIDLRAHCTKHDNFKPIYLYGLYVGTFIDEESRVIRALVAKGLNVHLGSAYCDPDDDWDEKKGEKLALQRALEHVPDIYGDGHYGIMRKFGHE